MGFILVVLFVVLSIIASPWWFIAALVVLWLKGAPVLSAIFWGSIVLAVLFTPWWLILTAATVLLGWLAIS